MTLSPESTLDPRTSPEPEGHAEALAEILSIAAHVEPSLVRQVRLSLLPEARPAVEAELWFGPWVAARGLGGLTLDVDALPALRERLLRRPWADSAFKLVHDEHVNSDLVTRAEEALTASALRPGPEMEQELEGLWKGVLGHMASDPGVALNAARWLVEAQHRLPAPALATETGRLVMQLARIGVRGELAEISSPEKDAAQDLALEVFGRRDLGLEMLQDGVALSIPPQGEAHRVSVPATSPLQVWVSHQAAASSRRVILLPRGRNKVRLVPDVLPEDARIFVDTLAGQRFVLSSVRDEAARAQPVPGARWYQQALLYEVSLRSFRDATGDGTGDFQGLIEKLDYVQWLGVDCLVISPVFVSPMRDGGYDIADFTAILPECGTLEDFDSFVEHAHRRGIRVVMDFVLNHTSDAHPWFQASRSDPDGPYGDFYVWSDTDELYQDARIILNSEPSNWTWDPVRQQYFWHRFFSHEPDLNFDNPKVHEALMEAMSFWLDRGVDGFRLNAVPYLYERPGTKGENLPETHVFLKQLRTFIDATYADRVLLVEANQHPADVVAYFGEGGDECHMCFHFPLMPRIFMAVRRESRWPISEIMERTPAIPSNCQWGIFLRNHDELSLEMVPDEDRDYMLAEYARDPRMEGDTGIRRRLAPLLDNDTNQIKLFTALLLSLPGSPILYYGDEIGMGDNIWLGDRDGVRTPMQWTPDRNAGFSAATPGQLAIPPVQDPVYGYQGVNVEAQLENASSLLHWTRRMIHARRGHPAFGLGTFTDLGGSNATVFSFMREHGDDRLLCVFNLSRFPQPAELDLRQWEGQTSVSVFWGGAAPRIGELPVLLTLGGYAFYWFRLVAEGETMDGSR